MEKETNGPEYEEYEEEIEIKAKDLAKYVANSDNLLKMKKAEADLWTLIPFSKFLKAIKIL